MTEMEQQLYDIVIGKDYPNPIVDVESTRKAASDIVWSFRKTPEVRSEGNLILQKHVNTSSSFRMNSKTKKSAKPKLTKEAASKIASKQ
jgi:deoxyribodipyrimidine photo-lyase